MSRHPFDLLMELETQHIRLDCAALHLARDVYPAVCVPRYLCALDALADQVAALRPGLAANLRYEAMHEVLVQTHNLTGKSDTYGDPGLHYLHRVLDSGIGIPISLSVIWIEVARRLKWPVSGVALPGTFIVRFDDPERFVLANPFQDGRSLSLHECQLLVKERFEGRLPFLTEYLKPVDARSILQRMLRNLRTLYLQQNNLPAVINVLQRMIAVAPDHAPYHLDLAAAFARAGDLVRAAARLQLYVQCFPNAAHVGVAHQNLHQLRAALLTRN